jgi:uncharacterized protein YjbI with pentapeptide repeats
LVSPDAEQKAPPDLWSKESQANLIASINESTKHVNTFTLSFFATCIYLAVGVASVTHEGLLLGSEVPLPLLGVKVPLVHFFALAPFLVAFLHLHLLLQEYFLFCKLEWLAESSYADGVAARFFPGLPVNAYVGKRYRPTVQVVLRVLRFGIYQSLPLFLLCWIQVRFLPYHGWGTTLWHQTLIILDIVLISYYSRKLSLLRKVSLAKVQWISAPARTVLRRVVLTAVALFSLFIAIAPGTCWEILLRRPMWGADWLLDRNLSLREKKLEGMDLRERNLRSADFTGSKLKADLRGADLSDAILINADLRGAKLMPTEGSDGVFDLPPGDLKLARIGEVAQDPKTYKPVCLARAKLRRAKLQGAKLILADLTDADLEHAALENAELTEAKLTGADLSFADLRGVELSRVHLELADLVEARLTGSRLFHAFLTGADLRGAYLEGADLTQAILDGANLAKAHLEAAELKYATSTGAVFWNASLQGATSLLLNGTIVRQAKMQGIDLCKGTKANGLALTDLRGVDFATAVAWGEIRARLPRGAVARMALPRLQAARERKATCLANYRIASAASEKPRNPEDMVHRRLLYSEGKLEGPMENWPPLADQGRKPGEGWSETAFFADLATALWDNACGDPLLAQALIKRTLNEFSPADTLLSKHLALQFKARQQSLKACSGFDEIDESQRERIIDMAGRADAVAGSDF